MASSPKLPAAALRATAVALVGGAAALSTLPASAADPVAPQAPSAQQTQQQPVAERTETKPTRAQIRAARRAELRARATRQRSSLVRVAVAKRGSSYVAGASGPNRFDCSGFTLWVYKKATGKSLPHFSGAQMDRTRRVSLRNLKPGDLLFYGPGGSQHVSMYIGKGRMIHATNPSSGVRIDSIRMGYYRARFAGAGRVIKW